MPTVIPHHTLNAHPEPLHTIGEAAAMLGISVPTVRLYEREGLVIPIRKASRHRLYTRGDIERIRCIRETINRKKVSIAGIKRLLALIPCWSIRNCPEDARMGCPALTDADAPCWVAKGRPWECADAECRSCRVYTEIADCTAVKSMIVSLATAPGNGS